MSGENLYQEAENPKTPAARLKALAETGEKGLIRKIARHPNAPGDLLRALSQSHNLALWQPIARHPNTPAETLWLVGYKFPAELLQNPAFPLLLLENPALLTSIPTRTLRALLREESVPEWILRWAAEPANRYWWKEIARNPALPQDILLGLLGARDSEARRCAGQNPAAPREIIQLFRRAGASAELTMWTAPPDPSLTPSEFTRLLDFGPFARALVAKHPSTPPEILEKLLDDEDSGVRMRLAQNPGLPHAWLDRLSRDTAITVRWAVASNPSTPPEILERLAQENSPGVRRSIASNPNAPQALLREVALAAGYQAAQNPSTPADILEKLATYEEAHIRRCVASNPNTPRKILSLLWRAGASRDLLEFTTPDPLMPWSELQNLLSLGPFARALVARHPNTPPEILEKLSTDSSEMACHGVAQNPNTPPEVLEALAKGPMKGYVLANPSVPEALFRAALEETYLNWGIARNPRTPVEVLRRMADGHYPGGLVHNPALPEDLVERLVASWTWCTRMGMAKRKTLRADLLEKLLQDRHPLVRKAAAQNPQAPAALLHLLRRAGSAPDLTEYAPPDLSLPPQELARLARGGPFSQALAARHPNTPAETLWRLSRAQVSLVTDMAQNPGTPLALLESLAAHSSRKVREAVASRKELSPRTLRRLACDKAPTVRKAAAQNPSCPEEFLQKLRRAGSRPDLGGFAAPDLSLSSKELAALAEEGFWAKLVVARHPNAPAAFLEECLASLHSVLREAAAQNPSCPQDVLLLYRRAGASPDLRLLEYPDPSLDAEELSRLAEGGPFAQLLVARYPRTSPEVREKLARSPWRCVREQVEGRQ